MEKPLKIITSLKEVPKFENDEEEREFRMTHALGGELSYRLLRKGPASIPPPRPRDLKQVTIWLDKGVKDRLRRQEELKGVDYKNLIKQFIVERLYEEEERDGLFGN